MRNAVHGFWQICMPEVCHNGSDRFFLREGRFLSLPAGAAGRGKSNVTPNMMSTAGRSLLAGSLLEEEVTQEEVLVRSSTLLNSPSKRSGHNYIYAICSEGD